ncbi:putative nuclease HARBI1 [Condylostylus longicornis]|uniref:putative nuclease HARBI1 n=1 Tax=Condylostylus longicornis TaxID=2530218 RepID=UPI00244E1EE1|nr:putative nuclease HARBI1 [Condylostylus longicornis]
MTSVELYFSDEEEEILEVKRIRRSLRDSFNPMELDNDVFIRNFRLSKPAFLHVYNSIEDKLQLNIRQQAVPNIIKLAAALKFFAYGDYQTSFFENDLDMGLAQSTLSYIFKEVFDALESNICSKYINFEYKPDELRRVKDHFYEKYGIPNVIGCLDNTHLKIIMPKKDLRHLYANRKGFFSLNILVVCDDLMHIRYIDARNPGATCDADVWNKSSLKRKLHEDYCNNRKTGVLLGDDKYPLTPYLLIPYNNVEKGSLQEKFNNKHKLAQEVIEKMFVILKSRFRCLLSTKELHYSPEKATQITNICAALHNICLKYKVEMPDIQKENNQNDDNSIDAKYGEDEIIKTSSNELYNGGKLVRDSILDLFKKS